MQGKKALFLFLALLLPVGIFIFLRSFGKNEFDVPAFYQDKAPIVAECGLSYKAPYVLPDSVMTQLAGEGKNELYLIHLSGDLSSRIKQEIKDKEVTFVEGTLFQKNIEQFKKCILLVPAQEDLIVVDSLGKIRGYYSSLDREEVDRLLLETKILLKKY
jgi:hypothetical protein